MRATFLDITLGVICLALIALLGVTLAQPAPCQPLPEVLTTLESRWGERPLWTGHLSDGRRAMVLAAPDGGSWTLVIVRPDGLTCGLGAGSSWLPGAGQPAGVRG